MIQKVLKKRKKRLVVAFDWTEVRNFHTLALVGVIKGRGVPLLWASYPEWELSKSQNNLEEGLLRLFREMVPREVKVIILADRGFGRTELGRLCQELGFRYIIRITLEVWIKTANYQGKLLDYPVKKGISILLKGRGVSEAVTAGAARDRAVEAAVAQGSRRVLVVDDGLGGGPDAAFGPVRSEAVDRGAVSGPEEPAERICVAEHPGAEGGAFRSALVGLGVGVLAVGGPGPAWTTTLPTRDPTPHVLSGDSSNLRSQRLLTISLRWLAANLRDSLRRSSSATGPWRRLGNESRLPGSRSRRQRRMALSWGWQPPCRVSRPAATHW